MNRVTDPKAFGRVAVLMGERRCFASTARERGERPAMDGRAGGGEGRRRRAMDGIAR